MQVVYHVTIKSIGTQAYIVPIERRCSACLAFQPLDAFHNDKVQPDGMKPICKQCRKNPQVRSFSTNNKVLTETRICTRCVQEKPLTKEYFAANPDGSWHGQCKQCYSEGNHQYWIDNLELMHARAHIKNAKPEYKAQRTKRHQERSDTDPQYLELRHQHGQRYYQSHIIEHRERYNRYMARKLEATVEKVDYKVIIERDNWTCHICNKPIDPNAKPLSAQSLDFDHVIPLQPRSGEPQGTHSEDNLKMSHKICNVRKSNKPMSALTERDKQGPRFY